MTWQIVTLVLGILWALVCVLYLAVRNAESERKQKQAEGRRFNDG